MKKTVIALLSTAFILGTGTAVFADDICEGYKNIGQARAHMKEMHPDLTTKELQERYESCHGSQGAIQSKNLKIMN
ncbi:hypothetical protein [Mesobacillus harenae]|uniref:hypothetical protein n=1 Tax=Mesobacillus harenae TaxID=2213203 RepID=UPI00158079E5|nr:hypothetical protein [Mesobacillus harenae]